jgi:hypothetical protein
VSRQCKRESGSWTKARIEKLTGLETMTKIWTAEPGTGVLGHAPGHEAQEESQVPVSWCWW